MSIIGDNKYLDQNLMDLCGYIQWCGKKSNREVAASEFFKWCSAGWVMANR